MTNAFAFHCVGVVTRKPTPRGDGKKFYEIEVGTGLGELAHRISVDEATFNQVGIGQTVKIIGGVSYRDARATSKTGNAYTERVAQFRAASCVVVDVSGAPAGPAAANGAKEKEPAGARA